MPAVEDHQLAFTVVNSNAYYAEDDTSLQSTSLTKCEYMQHLNSFIRLICNLIPKQSHSTSPQQQPPAKNPKQEPDQEEPPPQPVPQPPE